MASNPTLLSGYGGFNLGRTPFFNRNVMLLLLEARRRLC